ncbi:MAG: DoxX family protein, partial [Gemmatimonadetes bacterium]|nr:DoxX family protein [Gemmatimonadota bacterium]
MDFLVSDGFRTTIHVVGRVLFSMMFIMSGMNHLMKLNDMSAYAKSKGVPAPKALTAVSGLMIMVGGVLVLLGWHRFIGAGLIALFLFPTAMIMHAFWKETDPAARMNEMAHFMK